MITTLRVVGALLAAGALHGGCLPVSGERILGRDVALAEPSLAGLPPSLVVGITPVPGERRVLTAAELGRLARSNGINVSALQDVCFELVLRQIAKQEIVAAMVRNLPTEARVEVVDLAKTEAPAGEIEFPLSGLEPVDPAGNRLWRGWVHYSSTRKLPISARVKVLEDYLAIVATRDLAAGVMIDPAWLRAERQSGSLPREPMAHKIEDVQGLVLKRGIKAGTPLPISVLQPRLAVHRGETVHVNVASGWARLRFEAVAEADARAGDQISLRNPVSGRSFRARVDGNRRATVVIGGPVL